MKSGTLQNALFYKTKSGCRFGERCSYAHRQVDEQACKGSKKNDDKSAVSMLKKNDWHENVRQLVVNRDKNLERSGRPDMNRDTYHELKRGPIGRRSSNARHLGCLSRHDAAEVYYTEELRHAETNPTCEIHESYCTSH